MQSIFNWAKTHPLLSVLLGAMCVRMLSVIWSQGFIHSDDHYDTIAVAWNWLNGGLWGDDGWLRWNQDKAVMTGRFPLYTMFLLALMEFCQWLGMTSLNSMMYFIRFTHALISLLPVWAAFRIVQSATQSQRWAVGAGLVVAFHFAFPFLGVRNLIEVVGGSIWLVALWFLIRYDKERDFKWLYWAGIMTGLAWMIRFQIAFAVLPVPLFLWWRERGFNAAIRYSAVVAVMILMAGLVDLMLSGRFAGSTIVSLGYYQLKAMYNTVPLLYPLLLILFLVPPISLVVAVLLLRPSFIRTHGLLFWTSIAFVFIHSVQANQQERFIFPVLPAFAVLGVLAVWHYRQTMGAGGVWPRWLRVTVWLSVAVNLVLLMFFTFAYGHKGIIESLNWFEQNAPNSRVLLVQPEVSRWAPTAYAGLSLRQEAVRDWAGLKQWPVDPSASSEFDYFIVLPKFEDQLGRYVDSLVLRFGPLEPFFEIEPSYYDQTMYRLNPRHNNNYAAYLYRPARSK